MTHLTDDDLIEFHYLGSEGAESHLGVCGKCAAQLDAVRRGLLDAAAAGSADPEARPETFWSRQRFAVMRRIRAEEPVSSLPARTQRWAIAAAALVLLTSALLYRTSTTASGPDTVAPVATVTNAPPAATEAPAADVFGEIRAANDPWQSDELQPFQSAVDWESWTDEEWPAEDTL